MKRLLILSLMIGLAATAAADDATIEVGRFSAAEPDTELPAGWEPLAFTKVADQTDYALVREDGTTVVKAVSKNAASMLVRPVDIDPAMYPIIRWRWKVIDQAKNGDVRYKKGDDFAGRLYITFDDQGSSRNFLQRAKSKAMRLVYSQKPPSAAITYFWANRVPTGTMVPNSYTDRVMMIAVQSGSDNIGAWVQQERNVYEDFRQAFGKPPPMISGVAIMTDSDDTGSSALAFYGDIVFAKE